MLSLIVPCFNEENRLDPEPFIHAINQYEQLTLCFVNDGSTDQTHITLLQSFGQTPRIQILDLHKNVGKAEAVRQGILHMMNQQKDDHFFGFLDADLSTPVNELMGMFEVISQNVEIDMIFGLRLKRYGANVRRLVSRHFAGRVFATIANWLLKIEIYDSQCGAKIFRKKIVSTLFSDEFTSKWFFDLELIMRYRNHHPSKSLYQGIFEYPLLTWVEMGNSKIKLKDMLEAPFELLKIRKRYLK